MIGLYDRYESVYAWEEERIAQRKGNAAGIEE